MGDFDFSAFYFTLAWYFQEILLSTILFLKRNQIKGKKKNTKCEVVDVLTFLETCKHRYKCVDKRAISFVPGVTEIESHLIGCGNIFPKV